MKEIEVDRNVYCCNCNRQENIDGSAWIYCDIFNNKMLTFETFDETGETMGCNYYEGETNDTIN